ncbi:hypothetical protein O181_072776, partial [Austropuccinia psidii MF-1]|nr:hypothetical protein [Austropuccinia psidii MF-1]
APLDGTPEVPQLKARLDRGPTLEGRGPRSSSFPGVVGEFPGTSRTIFRGPEEDGEEEEESMMVLKSEQPVSNHSEESSLAIMQQLTQIMANLQEASVSESSSPPAFKTPSMKAPEFFDGTQPLKIRSFMKSFQLIFHNDLENFP